MAQYTHCRACGALLPADAQDPFCRECQQSAGKNRMVEVTQKKLPISNEDIENSFSALTLEQFSQAFPDLEILECINRGYATRIYKAKQKSLNRYVKLRLFAPEISAHRTFTERFWLESQSIARLSHPHIVAIFDFGQQCQMLYQLTEFVDGQNLSELFHSGHIDVSDALRIVSQICDGLQYAHDHGVIHRNVRSENILVDRQKQVKIADFGMLTDLLGSYGQKSLGDAAHKNDDPAICLKDTCSTDDAASGARADIHAVGRVFYQMLTGKQVDDGFEFLPRTADVDERISKIVLKALENEPGRQFHTVGEIKTEIDKIASTFISKEDIGSVSTLALSLKKQKRAGLSIFAHARWQWGLAATLVLIALYVTLLAPRRSQTKVEKLLSPPEHSDNTAAKITAPVGPSIQLPDRTTVELRAVAEYPLQDNQWWAPNGSSIAHAQYESSTLQIKPDDTTIVRQLVLRLQNSPADLVAFRLYDYESVRIESIRVRDRDITGLWVLVMRLPAGQDLATFKVGIASSDWISIGQFLADKDGEGSSGSSFKFRYKAATESSDGVRVSLTCSQTESDIRLVAINLQNEVQAADSLVTSGSPDLRKLRATYSKLSQNQIKRFEIQIRPYWIIECRNIALRMGVVSDPAITYLRDTSQKDR